MKLCECGKEFKNGTSYGGHKAWCCADSDKKIRMGFKGLSPWKGKSSPRKNAKHTIESKILIKEKRKLQVFTEETREKMRLKRTGKKHKSETLVKMSNSAKETWKDEEIAKKRFCGIHRKPNKVETFLTSQIDNVRPTDFLFSGDGKIWISGRCPDWFNVNGKKQVIEFFGRRWHPQSDEQDRIEHYKKFGYDCLVIWSEELKNIEVLKAKITSF